MLDKLREMTGGDEERIKVYVALYLESMPEYCKQLKTSIDSCDFNGIQKAAHSIKPLLSTMGLDELYQSATQLETNILEKNSGANILQSAVDLLHSLETSISETRKQLA